MRSGPRNTSATSALLPVGAAFSDSLDDTALSFGARRTNALGSLRIQTGAGCYGIVVSVVSVVSTANDKSLGVFIDGAWSQSLTPTSTGADETFVISLDGLSHVVEIVNGWQQLGNAGSFIRRIAFSGGTASVLPNPSASRRLVVYGDSIALGAVAAVMPRDGWIAKLRTTFPGRISLEGWGGRSLYGDSADIPALAARLVGLCFGAGVREIWDAIGTNDWGVTGGDWNAADFGAGVGALYDAIHALDSGIRIYSQTPIITLAEAKENAFGEVIGDYRAVKAAQVAARAAWVTGVDGTALVTSAEIDADGLHPTTAGHATLFAGISEVLV